MEIEETFAAAAPSLLNVTVALAIAGASTVSVSVSAVGSQESAAVA